MKPKHTEPLTEQSIGEGLAAGRLSVAQAIKALRTLPAQKKPRGRPKGSRNEAEPHGLAQARRYLDLVEHEGMQPMKAARKVAAEFSNIDVTTVFKSRQRHERRLIQDELDQIDEILYKAGKMFVEHYPDSAADLLAEWNAGLEGIAARVESRGNPVVAQHVRAYAGQWTRGFLIVMGQFYLNLVAQQPPD